jgi:ATP-dependent DNA helicase RecG
MEWALSQTGCGTLGENRRFCQIQTRRRTRDLLLPRRLSERVALTTQIGTEASLSSRPPSGCSRSLARRRNSPEATTFVRIIQHEHRIRYALGKHEDADGLACDCVGFANGMGGMIVLGIEDGQEEPPAGQNIADDYPDKLRKRLAQITVNVGVAIRKVVADNSGEFVEIQVFRNDQSIAATSDGRYFIRVSDETRRLMPDDLGRLMAEKNSFVWELQTTRRVPAQGYDDAKLADFVKRVRASDRVSEFVRGKAESELLEHYLFVRSGLLTNLGILWIGRREDRAALLYPPEIQCIKYDERGRKVRKQVWNDYSLNPLELIEAVWREVPDWKEFYELPDGLFRKSVPHYDEVVVRELLANALAHRPYTQRGDIFLNLHPDRLEVHNPGLLPIGVTPRNILHTTSKRNPHLAKVFYDLKLMEGEGSGFDRMYEVLLTSGRPIPEVQQGDDRVVVTVRKQIARPAIVDLMVKADQTFATQSEGTHYAWIIGAARGTHGD